MRGSGARAARDRAVRPRAVLRLALPGILLALSLLYVATGIYTNLVVVGPGLANRSGTRVGADFSAFYAVGREVWAGDAASVYDERVFRRAHARALGTPAPAYPWAYPPTFFFLLAPMALLPPVASFWTWTAATVLAVVLALRRLLPDSLLPGVAPIFPGIAHAAFCNPTGTLTAALFAGGLATLERAPVLAGLCFALLTYKPHLVVLVAPCLLAGGHRRAFASMAACTAALLGLATAAFGVDAWAGFAAAVPRIVALTDAGRLPVQRMPTVYAAIIAAAGTPVMARTLQIAASAIVLSALSLVWWRSARLSVRALALGAAVPLATPYGYDYDMGFLVVPFVLLAAEARGGARSVGPWGLALVWVTPVVPALVAESCGYQVGPLLLAALLGLAVRAAVTTPNEGRLARR